MRPEDRYDSLIRFYAARYGLDWQRIKRQIEVESNFDPKAVSPTGARGLAQWMPARWREWDDDDGIPALDDPHNPEEAIEALCKFMAFLYGRFPEIPDPHERYRFALAAYNTGRSNINRCLALARAACGQPASLAAWKAAGRPPGSWQTWEFASRFLPRVTGRHAQETIEYVRRIMG
ncbi:MAG TPA: transglycosylase SLT domain-containing protein [Thermaerobacter sp.]